MDLFAEIKSLAAHPDNPYLKKARENGRRVIGYFCSYIPEEIIEAAGMIPYRVRAAGSTGTGKGDAYFSPLNCSQVRHCFNQALVGAFDFLSGIVFMNGCDHNRRLYDNWKLAAIKPDFRYLAIVPRVINETAIERYAGILNGFKTAIEEHFAVRISDDALREQIGRYNKKRALLARLSSLRLTDEPAIDGSEFLAVMLAVTAMPVSDAISLLERAIDCANTRAPVRRDHLRLLLAGNCVEDVAHVQTIEDAGGIVVADKICLGSQYFDTPVSEDSDPIEALSRRYLDRLSCARMANDYKGRVSYVRETAREYRVDGIVLDKLEFCTLFSSDSLLYRYMASDQAIPVLMIDRALYASDAGQLRTRLQAFYERIHNTKRAVTA